MAETKSPPVNSKIFYLGAVAILVLLLGYTAWGFISNRVASSTVLEVSDLTISKTDLIADGNDTSLVTITITNQEDQSPAAGIWIGLNVSDPGKATEEFSYFGWYSPEPSRSFYQTTAVGRATFQIRSKIAGDITYGIYAANPDQQSSGKYESLAREFTLHFQ